MLIRKRGFWHLQGSARSLGMTLVPTLLTPLGATREILCRYSRVIYPKDVRAVAYWPLGGVRTKIGNSRPVPQLEVSQEHNMKNDRWLRLLSSIFDN